jgi:hypothetical protein
MSEGLTDRQEAAVQRLAELTGVNEEGRQKMREAVACYNQGVVADREAESGV